MTLDFEGTVQLLGSGSLTCHYPRFESVAAHAQHPGGIPCSRQRSIAHAERIHRGSPPENRTQPKTAGKQPGTAEQTAEERAEPHKLRTLGLRANALLSFPS